MFVLLEGFVETANGAFFSSVKPSRNKTVASAVGLYLLCARTCLMPVTAIALPTFDVSTETAGRTSGACPLTDSQMTSQQRIAYKLSAGTGRHVH